MVMIQKVGDCHKTLSRKEKNGANIIINYVSKVNKRYIKKII